MGQPSHPRQVPDPEGTDLVPTTSADLQVHDPALLLRLTGPNSAYLRALGKELGIAVGVRGNTIHLQGPSGKVVTAERVLNELLEVLLNGSQLTELDVLRAARALHDNPELRLKDLFDDVVLIAADRKVITPKGVTQHLYIQTIREHDIVFGIGPAGTGKTYLAMAMAVRALQEKKVRRIILARPAVEAGEKLGFLPGDLAEKVNPYLRPLYDALHDMMDMERVQGLMQRGTIEVAPLAFMRGRTLNDSFVILDEAQNTTPEQMKMFLTRLGFKSKAVITGDVTQIDLPGGRPSGLTEAAAILANIEGIRLCHFTDADVVRHPLVQRIVRAYEQHEASRARPRQPPVCSAPEDVEQSDG